MCTLCYTFLLTNLGQIDINTYILFDVSPLRVYRNLLFSLNIKNNPKQINQLKSFINDNLANIDILIYDEQPFISPSTIDALTDVCLKKYCRLLPLAYHTIEQFLNITARGVPTLNWELIQPFFRTLNLKISLIDFINRLLSSSVQESYEETLVRNELLILFILEYQHTRELLLHADIYKDNITLIFDKYEREELVQLLSNIYNRKIDRRTKDELREISKIFFGRRFGEWKWIL